MNLHGLLEIQTELNSHCPRFPNKQELLMAIVAECGELAQATKGDWCWWTRNGVPFQNRSRDEIADELADILCFLLVGILLTHHDVLGNNEQAYKTRIQAWESAWASSKPRWMPSSFLAYLIRDSSSYDFVISIASFVRLARSLGFVQEEVEAAYLRKVEVNKQRWEQKAS
jgi:dimeric dUTPase (all-alpha-NTP-PPase superfamily)